MKIAHITSPEFGTVPIIDRRIDKTDSTYIFAPPGEVIPSTALDKQISGSHYKTLGIQPVEYIRANDIGYFEGNVIKYVTRWKNKNGVADLEKAKHYLEMLIEFENAKP